MKLNENFKQTWISSIESSSKSTMYTIVKNHDLTFEYYLTKLYDTDARILLKFRTSNHNLPVETGRWKNVPFVNRICKLCNNDVGDEFHYLFKCPSFVNERKNI